MVKKIPLRWVAVRSFATLRAGLLLALAAGLPLAAQDFERTQPRPPAADDRPAALPVVPDGAEAVPPPGTGGDEVLVGALRGLVFVPGPEAVAIPAPDVAGVVVRGPAVLDSADFIAAVQPFLGQPVTLEALNRILREAILHCRREDRPMVNALVPEQDITGGVVQVVVVESRVGRVEARGQRWFSGPRLAAEVRVNPGDPIRASELRRELAWLNRNPFRRTEAVFAPGQEAGTTDIILQTEDRFPVRVYAGYEDNGNALTGWERWQAGVNWGDAFGAGHQLNYQFTGSRDFEGLRAHAALWIAPLPWRHTLTVFGVVSESAAVSGPFALEGSGAQLGARYALPLPAGRAHTHELVFGYDWKQSDNSLEFGPIPINAATTDLGHVVLGYRASREDPWGGFTVSPQVFWSPAGMWGRQTAADYGSVRAGADPEYVYFRLEAGRVTRLPGGFSLVHALTWQAGSTNLLPSEQLNAGGAGAVRGYDDRNLVNTDEGWILRNELRTPPVSLLGRSGNAGLKDQWQALVFFDWASVRAHDGRITLNDGRAVDRATLAGAGLGLRYTIAPRLSLSADYGWQLRDTGERRDARLHLSLTAGY